MFHNSPPLQVFYTPPQACHTLQQSETVTTPYSPIYKMSIANDDVDAVEIRASNMSFSSTMNYHHVPIHRALPKTPPNARRATDTDENKQNIVKITEVDPSQSMDNISHSILSVSTTLLTTDDNKENIINPCDDTDDNKQNIVKITEVDASESMENVSHSILSVSTLLTNDDNKINDNKINDNNNNDDDDIHSKHNKKLNGKQSNMSSVSASYSYSSLLSPSIEAKHHRNSINVSSISSMMRLDEEKEDTLDVQRSKRNLSSISGSFSSGSFSSSSSDNNCMASSSNNNLQKMEEKEEEKQENTESTPIQKFNQKTENGATFHLQSKLIENIDEIDNYICNDVLKRNIGIYFDKYSLKKEDNYYFNKHSLLSLNGLTSGYYEWSIKILKCEGSVQEMGIVSNPDIDNIDIKQNEGIMQTQEFGARAIYGNRLESVYYASYNDNNKQRCFKNLSNKLETCWGKGDIIKICLDLNKYRIKFYLNNKKVRKKISVQSNKTYYPIISFVGDFKYEIKL